MDVTTAFLHGDLHDTVFMKLPQGYTGMGSRITLNQYEIQPSTLVCRLIKSLYGLKQIPGLWFTKLSKKPIALGYVQSKTDYSLFTNLMGESIILVLVYVDHLLISGNSAPKISNLKLLLSTSFHMKDLGNVRYFLGIEIDKTNVGYFLSQKKYTLDLLQEFGMLSTTLVKIPVDIHLKLDPTKGDILPDPHPYQRLLGNLIYLTVISPDITSQFMP